MEDIRDLAELIGAYLDQLVLDASNALLGALPTRSDEKSLFEYNSRLEALVTLEQGRVGEHYDPLIAVACELLELPEAKVFAGLLIRAEQRARQIRQEEEARAKRRQLRQAEARANESRTGWKRSA